MEQIEIRRIDYLLKIDMFHLINESKEEGFRIVERLVQDYKSGSNTFNRAGEVLYGVFDKEGKIIAVGGINIDPYTKEGKIGRVRRVYVVKSYRKRGVGRLLLERLISHASGYFEILVLRTNTEQADRFYRAFGFRKTDRSLEATHYMEVLR